MIKIEGLFKAYKKKIVLNNFSGFFKDGDFCALVGNNGAGKSTLLKILSHLELQDKGTCEIGGHLNTDDSIPLKEKMAFISEDIQFFFPGSVEDFIKQYKTFYPQWDGEFLEYLFSNNFVDRDTSFNDCSRGQKMQLVLALSLARQPQYIFIDEVTAVMDVLVRKIAIDFLKDYGKKKKAIIILATNILTEVDFIANKMLMLNHGDTMAFDEVSILKENFVKLRKLKVDDREVFHQKNCILINQNSDGSLTYMMNKDDFKGLDKGLSNNLERDKRDILISDLFTYLSATTRLK